MAVNLWSRLTRPVSPQFQLRRQVAGFFAVVVVAEGAVLAQILRTPFHWWGLLTVFGAAIVAPFCVLFQLMIIWQMWRCARSLFRRDPVRDFERPPLPESFAWMPDSDYPEGSLAWTSELVAFASRYGEQHPDSFKGAWVEREAQQPVCVAVFTDELAPHVAALDPRVRVVASGANTDPVPHWSCGKFDLGY